MGDLNISLLRPLSEIHGITGRESAVADLIKWAVAEIGVPQGNVSRDILGNVIVHLPGKGPTVAVAAHMDEIGFLVKHIDDDGFLRIAPVGGFDPKTVVAARVVITGKDGTRYGGCIGTKPIHVMKEEDRKKPVEIEGLFVDVLGFSGVPDKGKTVKDLISLGASVCLVQSLIQVGDVICGKCLDDRIGVYAGIELVRRLHDVELDCDLYVVFTVQEEVGVRGATVAGNRIQPDIAIAIDVTIAGMPDMKADETPAKFGEGVAIALLDKGTVSHQGLVEFMQRIAEERGIKYQLEVATAGGTDASALQRAGEGAAAVTLSLPCRYVHSIVETVHAGDVEATIDLLTEFIRNVARFWESME